ncbi:MAG TPA: twin-arginine translocase TatA/TatE family subunit [Acidimicrobiales bacterium]|nr:twin-arginine translocase TatA/TatE family subunit [Acidimicrobiales bacterium]
MGSLDPAKILMILVVILIVMGPDRLPKVARQLGAAWHEVTRIRQEVTDEVRAVMPDLDLTSIPRIPSVRGTLTGFLADPRSTPSDAAGETPGAEAKDGAADSTTETDPRSADAISPALGDFSPPADDPSMN